MKYTAIFTALSVLVGNAFAQEPPAETSPVQLILPCEEVKTVDGDPVCVIPHTDAEPIIEYRRDPRLTERYPEPFCESYAPPSGGITRLVDNIPPEKKRNLNELYFGGQRYAYAKQSSLSYDLELAAHEEWEESCPEQVCAWHASLDPIQLASGEFLLNPPLCDQAASE